METTTNPPRTSFTESPRPGRFLGEWQLWALALVLVATMSPWLLLGRTLFFRDIHLMYVPTVRIVHQQLHGARFSLWDETLHGGEPLIGDPNRNFLYPSRLLYAFFSPVSGFNLEIALHFLLGGLGAYLLSRTLGLLPSAAVSAGLVFALCGFSLSVTNNISRFFVLHWMPLLLLWGHLLGTTGRRRWFVLLVLGHAAQWLSSGVELVLLTAVCLLGWQLVVASPIWSRPRRLVTVAAALILAVGLACMQILPVAVVISESQRAGAGVGDPLVWSVHPLRLAELVLPGLLGPVGTAYPPDTYWGAPLVDSGYPYIQSFYVGLLPLTLAIGAGWLCRTGPLARGLRRFLLLVLVCAVLLSCGRYLPGFETLLSGLPGFEAIRFPVKLIGLATMPIALLCAAGIDTLAAARTRKRALRTLVVAAAVGSGTAWLLLRCVPQAADCFGQLFFGSSSLAVSPVAMRIGITRSFAQAATITTLAALVCAGRSPVRRLAGILLAVLIAADLVIASQAVMLHAPRELLSSEPPIVSTLRQRLDGGRLYRVPDHVMVLPIAEDSAEELVRWRIRLLSSYIGAGYGIPMIFHDDDPIVAQRRIVALGARLERLPWPRRLPILSAARVSLIISPGTIDGPGLRHELTIASFGRHSYNLYRNERVMPPAWFVSSAILAGSSEQALQLVCAPGFDPATTVVLESMPEEAPGNTGSDPTHGASVELLQHQPEEWLFRIEAPSEGYLVLSEVSFPGWRAEIDGSETRLLAANAAFTALSVAPGKHLIRRWYDPPEMRAGVVLSVLSAGLLFALAACWYRWLSCPLPVGLPVLRPRR